MLKNLGNDDKVVTEITTTNGYFDGGVGTLAGTNLSTSSLSSTQKSYYYNLQYNSKDHFSVSYGHIGGSGSAIEDANREGTTQAIYKQFYNLVEPQSDRLRDQGGWVINNATASDCYFISSERLQMKDRINPGTWTVTLSGSRDVGGVLHAGELLLTDNSVNNDADAPGSPFGERYSVRSGSAGVLNADSREYGKFYPDAGLIVLSAAQVSHSLGGGESNIQNTPASSGDTGLAPDVRVNVAADNAHKIARAMISGSVTMRSEEKQYIYDYFCRAKAGEYNYTNNVTFWSGSTWHIRHNDMVTNPQTFISEVGLYDDAGQLMAVGRLSSALNKNRSSEAIVKVRLTY